MSCLITMSQKELHRLEVIQKIGYTPRGRKPGPRTDFMNDPAVIARRQARSDLDAAE